MELRLFIRFIFRLSICYCVCSVRGETSEEIFLNDFQLKPQFVEGIEKFKTMLLDDFRFSDDILSNEIVEDFFLTLKSCQKGMEEAADKVTNLLDLISDDENQKKGKKSYNDSEQESSDDSISEADKADDSVSDNILMDDFFEVYTSEEKTILHERYVKSLRKVFKTLRHACSSLPKALPRMHKKQRNPQTIAQRLAISLKRWAEKWIDLVEIRLEEFLVVCVKDENCEHYFHKIIKMLVDILEEYHFYLDKDTLSVLQEFQRHKYMSSMNSLTYVQRAALTSGDSFGSMKEDDNAYHIASGIHDKLGKNSWFDVGNQGEESLNFLSKILHKTSLKTTPKETIIEIEENKIVQKIPKTFLSAAFGTSVIQDGWGQVKNQTGKFVKIVSALSPAQIRMGGSGANFLTYDPLSSIETETNKKGVLHPKNHIIRRKGEGKNVLKKEYPRPLKKGVRNQYFIETNQVLQKQDPIDSIYEFKEVCEVQYGSGKIFSNFTMTRKDYKLLIDIVRELDSTLIFDLNQFYRVPNGDWDPTNAKIIILDPYSSEVPIVWQIGNEPNNYKHHFNWSITPEEAVKDYKILNNILRHENIRSSQGPLIIGPDVTRPRNYFEEVNLQADSMEFLETFLKEGVDEIDVVTWHQYYFNGRTATVEDFLSIEVMNEFPQELNVVVSMRNRLAPDKPIWITETANAWGGGAPELSGSFAACFPWLDKLGAAAIGGVDNVFRQTLYGGCYALLDEDLNPNPDYWASVLHKKLIGQEVLLPRVRLAKKTLRIYSHCLENSHHLHKKGAIVILVLNLSNEDEILKLMGKSIRSSPKYLYELSAPNGNLKSRNILLNKEILMLSNDGSLPGLKPILIDAEDLVVSPWTLNFWVIPDAKYDICP